MRVKLFYLVEVVRRTDAQAATSLKNLGNDFPLPELWAALAGERCLATVGKLASGANAQSDVEEGTRPELSVATTGYEEGQSLRGGDVVGFDQNQGLADSVTRPLVLRGGGTLASGAFAVSHVERVSVAEWEFVEAPKESRSLALTVGAEPRIRRRFVEERTATTNCHVCYTRLPREG